MEKVRQNSLGSVANFWIKINMFEKNVEKSPKTSWLHDWLDLMKNQIGIGIDKNFAFLNNFAEHQIDHINLSQGTFSCIFV